METYLLKILIAENRSKLCEYIRIEYSIRDNTTKGTPRLTSFMPSSLPRLLVPRRGGKTTSCQPPPPLHICKLSDCEEWSPRARLLLLRLSRRCLALDFLTGAAASSSGSLCTSQRDGDLKRRRGLVGEVTGEVSLCTRVPNMVIINRPRTPQACEYYGKANARPNRRASPASVPTPLRAGVTNGGLHSLLSHCVA